MGKKINEAEELENFLRSSAISILYDNQLHIMNGNIVSISHNLVMKGEVFLKADSIAIPHLQAFPFIHRKENSDDPKGRVVFTFSMNDFKEIEQLQVLAKEHVQTMLAYAISLDLKANLTRKRASIIRDAFLNKE
jgi:hypothetical protein